MSRIGKQSVMIPAGVEVVLSGNKLSVKGPKGALSLLHHYEVSVVIDGEEIRVQKTGKSKMAPALWGTTVRLIQNMITGVTQGFSKQLELNGVGYRMSLQGQKLVFALGFSHPVEVVVAPGLSASIENNVLTVSGIDRQQVGQFSAEIKKLKPVEPYKGKGFRYVGETVLKKEGKKSAA
ncbi:MAG: 50S ribosomal protein L6 [Candidatus Moraniibacteriota bacterium]|nr:MAG: 50S ribosomal protein L6 [Candidatus Moranbacteria bacterium]